MPPKRLAPPSTAAAITSNSRPSPKPASSRPIWLMTMKPASPAQAPEIT